MQYSDRFTLWMGGKAKGGGERKGWPPVKFCRLWMTLQEKKGKKGSFNSGPWIYSEVNKEARWEIPSEGVMKV